MPGSSRPHRGGGSDGSRRAHGRADRPGGRGDDLQHPDRLDLDQASQGSDADADQHDAEKAAQYATSNKALEDRVAVLERIVTDRGYDVATQIEALRDQRRVEEPLETRETERSD
jgi:hypothetical protein